MFNPGDRVKTTMNLGGVGGVQAIPTGTKGIIKEIINKENEKGASSFSVKFDGFDKPKWFIHSADGAIHAD